MKRIKKHYEANKPAIMDEGDNHSTTKDAAFDLSLILPIVHKMAVDVDDMVSSWDTNTDSVSIDLNLIENYLEAYMKFATVMDDIRSHSPSEYMTNREDATQILEALMNQKMYKDQADRCRDLIERVNRYMEDEGVL